MSNWLTGKQSVALWQTPDCSRLKDRRDRALLALLLACGLRRHEAVGLRIEHLEQREEHRAIVDLKSKAGHVGTVPIPGWVMEEIKNWLNFSGIERGKIFRRDSKGGRALGEGISERAVWHIVKPIGEADRSGKARFSRSASNLRPAMSCLGRRTGTDPVSLGACFHPDNGTIPGLQAADSICGERSDWDRSRFHKFASRIGIHDR